VSRTPFPDTLQHAVPEKRGRLSMARSEPAIPEKRGRLSMAAYGPGKAFGTQQYLVNWRSSTTERYSWRTCRLTCLEIATIYSLYTAVRVLVWF